MQTYKLIAAVALAGLLACGCASKGPATTLWIHEQVNSSLPVGHVMTVELPRLGLKLAADPHPALTEKDVLSADVYQTAGGAAILLRFNIHGALVLEELTTGGRGQYLIAFLNKRPVAAWLIDRRLSTGQFLVEADLTDAEAQQVVDALNKMSKDRP